MFCCDGHKGEKFPLTPRSYYIPMKSDSALVGLYVTAAELEAADSIHLAKKLHSSKEWMEIIAEFNARHSIRQTDIEPSPYQFPDIEEDDAKSLAGNMDDYHDAASDIVSSTLKGAGAFKMLSSSGLESLKALFPVAKLFADVKEEVYEESVEQSGGSIPGIISSIDSILQMIPDGLTEVDDKMKHAVKMLEDEMGRMAQEHTLLKDQIVGSVDLGAFVEEFGALAQVVLQVNQDVSTTQATAAAASKTADTAKSRAAAAAITAHTSKSAKVIKAFVDRFNGELANLAQGVAAGAVGVLSPIAESPATIHHAGYHDRSTDRYTTGRNLWEYERLTRNGFVKVLDFRSEAEATAWLQLRNSAPTVPTPSSPNPRDEFASGTSEGEIAAQMSILKDLIKTLESDVADLRKGTTTKGVSLDKFSFDTFDELLALLKAENIPPTSFGVAVDPVSFFCHHKSGKVDESTGSPRRKPTLWCLISCTRCMKRCGQLVG